MFGESTDTNTEFTALPVGVYGVTLDNVDLDETGKHSMINAQFTVIAGEFKNRKLWKRFYFSDGTAAKFLPWQFGIMGIKTELDAKACNSHADTARAALDLMGGVIGSAFTVNVEITEGTNGKQYNDLVLTERGVKENTLQAAQVKNHAPQMDASENIPF